MPRILDDYPVIAIFLENLSASELTSKIDGSLRNILASLLPRKWMNQWPRKVPGVLLVWHYSRVRLSLPLIWTGFVTIQCFVSSGRTAILPLYLCLLLFLSCVQLFVTPWTAAHQPSLSFTTWSLLKFMSIESVMPSNHLILCHLKTKFLPPSEIDMKALWIAPVGNRHYVPWALSPSYVNTGWNWNSAPLISKRGWLPTWSVILSLSK